MKKNLIKIFIIGFLILSNFSLVRSQEKKYSIYLTWKAETFSEVDYQGKNLPVVDSKIYVSAQIFDKKGRRIDPNQFVFYWEINFDDKFFDCLEYDFFKPTIGRNKICFRASKINFSPYKVKLAIQKQNYLQRKSLEIPYLSPEIVIVPQGKMVSLKKISLKPTMNFSLKKYFFSNLNYLDVIWYLDKKRTKGKAENPFSLTLEFYPNLPNGKEFYLYAECVNKKNHLQRVRTGPIKIIKE